MDTHSMGAHPSARVKFESNSKLKIGKIKFSGRKFDLEISQFSETNSSLSWALSLLFGRQERNAARKEKANRKGQQPNFFQKWRGRNDEVAKFSCEKNPVTIRQTQTVEATLANGRMVSIDSNYRWDRLGEHYEAAGDTPDAAQALRRNRGWINGVQFQLGSDGNLYVNPEESMRATPEPHQMLIDSWRVAKKIRRKRVVETSSLNRDREQATEVAVEN